MLSNVYAEFHTVMYEYHRLGMDVMVQNQRDAKLKLIDALARMKNVNDRRPNSFLVRTFFDAKSDEIQAVFSGGPSVDIVTLVENLNRMAPTKRSNWTEIKF
nr:DUF4835 family protein [Ulvibacter sp. MAR_2010_11]